MFNFSLLFFIAKLFPLDCTWLQWWVGCL